MEDPQIDVLIVTYNSVTHVANAILSLEKQKGVDLRYFIQDNGSTDETVQEVKRLSSEGDVPIMLLLDQSNPGYASAVNTLFRHSSAPYVLVLNPDTSACACTDELALLKLSGYADSDTVGLVSPLLWTEDGSIDDACRRREPTLWRAGATFLVKSWPCLSFMSRWDYHYAQEYLGCSHAVDAINGAFMLGSRKKIELVGLMDERFWMYGEDLDWCRRFRQAGFQNWYVGGESWMHVKAGSEAGRRGARTQTAFLRSMDVYFSKWNEGRVFWPARRLVSFLVNAGIRVAAGKES